MRLAVGMGMRLAVGLAMRLAVGLAMRLAVGMGMRLAVGLAMRLAVGMGMRLAVGVVDLDNDKVFLWNTYLAGVQFSPKGWPLKSKFLCSLQDLRMNKSIL